MIKTDEGHKLSKKTGYLYVDARQLSLREIVKEHNCPVLITWHGASAVSDVTREYVLDSACQKGRFKINTEPQKAEKTYANQDKKKPEDIFQNFYRNQSVSCGHGLLLH